MDAEIPKLMDQRRLQAVNAKELSIFNDICMLNLFQENDGINVRWEKRSTYSLSPRLI